ncbi:MAG TPA: EsaB/YukD family protein [Thermoleophilaceae bacterium]|nr:EsaB/YukD family protein [Thermoleophilaceae bacterium]
MTTTTKTCAVTIAGPDRRVDLVVSTETPVSELIPTFVEMSSEDPPNPDAAQPVWSVAPPGQQPLPLDRTLREAGIADGDVLTLTEVRSQEQAPPRPAELRKPRAKHGPLSERMQTLLPTRLDSLGRVSVATRAFFGYEEESAVIESAPPPVESAQARLSRPEQRGPLARARFAWRESDYLGRLDRRIAEPRLTRCVTVAVVSPKGGVGKTTTTALLGSLLAGVRRDRIVAVDTNPDYGSLGRALTPDHSVYVDDLIDVLDRPDLSATALDGHLGRASDGLMVLPAPTHPARMAALDEAAYTNVIQQLKSLVGVLVLDCGTGLQEPAARAALHCADQLLLISDAHPSTASLVAEAAEQLQQVGPPITIVVNKLPRSRRELTIDLSAFDELVPEARGLWTVGEEPQAAARVARGDFQWRDAPDSWKQSFREIAVGLAADWPELGLAR